MPLINLTLTEHQLFNKKSQKLVKLMSSRSISPFSFVALMVSLTFFLLLKKLFLYNFFLFAFSYDFPLGLIKKGSRPYTTGEMNSAQFGAIVGQVNLAHQPPMVRFFYYLI